MTPRRPIALHLAAVLDFGGVERHLEVLAEAGRGGRFEHVFAALGGGGAAEQAIRRTGSAVHCLGGRPSVYSPATLWAAWRLIRRVRPDVVHAHGGETNFHGVLAARAAGVRVVLAEEIGIPNHSGLGRRVFRAVYRLTDRVVAVSEAVKAWLLEAREAGPSQVVVIDNPVRLPPPPSRRSEASGPVRFAFVGRLVPEKGLDGLLRAASELRGRGCGFRLTLIGEGEQRASLETLAAHLGLSDHVTFAGFRSNPWPAAAEADVFVLPSLHEGFGLALIEAMAVELPAVSTRVGVAADVVAEGVTGWLAAPGDSAELAAKMQQAIAAGRTELRAMGAAARRAVSGRYQPDVYVATLEALYERLLGARGASAASRAQA